MLNPRVLLAGDPNGGGIGGRADVIREAGVQLGSLNLYVTIIGLSERTLVLIGDRKLGLAVKCFRALTVQFGVVPLPFINSYLVLRLLRLRLSCTLLRVAIFQFLRDYVIIIYLGFGVVIGWSFKVTPAIQA